MKRICIFFVIVSLFVGKVFADGDTVLRVQSLINKGLFKNKLEIMSLSSNLTSNEKENLINRNKINGYFPMYMNSGLGYGIGSFIAKDYVGGSIHCAIDVACDVIMIAMFAVYIKSAFDPISNGYHTGDADKIVKNARNYLYAGIATSLVLIVNRIAQIVSLTVHVNKYNNTLAEVFVGASASNNNSGKVAFNLVPIVDEKSFGFGINFALPKRNS